jgi:hypothetical protein
MLFTDATVLCRFRECQEDSQEFSQHLRGYCGGQSPWLLRERASSHRAVESQQLATTLKQPF